MPKKKTTSTPEEDRRRLIAAAKELGCDESAEEFERKIGRLATVKPIANADLKKGGRKKAKPRPQ